MLRSHVSKGLSNVASSEGKMDCRRCCGRGKCHGRPDTGKTRGGERPASDARYCTVVVVVAAAAHSTD